MEAEPWTRFGNVLKALRAERKLSQADIAERAWLDQTYISLLERGERQPTLPTLYRISGALGVSLMELIAAIEEK